MGIKCVSRIEGTFNETRREKKWGGGDESVRAGGEC